jgi:hypothetical protein
LLGERNLKLMTTYKVLIGYTDDGTPMAVRQHPVDDLSGHAHQFSPKKGTSRRG